MIIFGVCFVLYFVKFSAGRRFWTERFHIKNDLLAPVFSPVLTCFVKLKKSFPSITEQKPAR